MEENLKAEGATYERIARERQATALPILEAMEKWMESAHVQCTPSEPMGKAFDYAYKLWPRICRYVLDGRYRIDNNPVERSQRPSVMGRKNYLFSKSDLLSTQSVFSDNHSNTPAKGRAACCPSGGMTAYFGCLP